MSCPLCPPDGGGVMQNETLGMNISSAIPSTAPPSQSPLPFAFDERPKPESVDSMDVLAAVFFVVAAGWLLVAILYACLALTFLRLRARGQLDSIYEEDFGRLYICGTRYYLSFGCVFRRYVQHIQRDRGRPESQGRFMTREERREAMEVLLRQYTTKAEGMPVDASSEASCASGTENETIGEDLEAGDGEDGDDNSQAPDVCCICLGEYENGEVVLKSPACSHQYHFDCVLDWLQRHSNSECPCCRVAMVSEDDVWKSVKRFRRDKRRQVKRERRKRRSTTDAESNGEAVEARVETESADSNDAEGAASSSTDSNESA